LAEQRQQMLLRQQQRVQQQAAEAQRATPRPPQVPPPKHVLEQHPPAYLQPAPSPIFPPAPAGWAPTPPSWPVPQDPYGQPMWPPGPAFAHQWAQQEQLAQQQHELRQQQLSQQHQLAQQQLAQQLAQLQEEAKRRFPPFDAERAAAAAKSAELPSSAPPAPPAPDPAWLSRRKGSMALEPFGDKGAEGAREDAGWGASAGGGETPADVHEAGDAGGGQNESEGAREHVDWVDGRRSMGEVGSEGQSPKAFHGAPRHDYAAQASLGLGNVGGVHARLAKCENPWPGRWPSGRAGFLLLFYERLWVCV